MKFSVLILLLTELYGEHIVAHTRFGEKRGVVQPKTSGLAQEVISWLGLRYAKPMGPSTRFAAPQELDQLDHIDQTCDKHGNICPQLRFLPGIVKGDEDCLFLNIYTPKRAFESKKKLPVMFWIFGGGFVVGDGYELSLYDGANWVASRDVVLVTINYRLGAFGFWAGDSMRDDNGSTGNWALLDQRMALKWVHENIAAFGGDASTLTIFGNSAGAASVMAHLTSPKSYPYFSRAIMQSNVGNNVIFSQNLTDATEYYSSVSEKLKCGKNGSPGQLECLRRLPQDAFVKTLVEISTIAGERMLMSDESISQVPERYSPAWPVFPNGFVIDGVEIIDQPLKRVQAGAFHKVPLILGSNKDDGTLFAGPVGVLFIPGLTFPAGPSVYNTIAHHIIPNQEKLVAKIKPLYASLSTGWLNPYKYSLRAARLVRDAVMTCPDRDLLRAWTANGGKAYHYVFTMNMGKFLPLPVLHTMHFSETMLMFKNWKFFPSLLGNDVERVADQFQCWWSVFASTGDPNGNKHHCKASRPHWPPHTSEDPVFMAIDYASKLRRIENVSRDYPDDIFPGNDRCDLLQHVSLGWHSKHKRHHNSRPDLLISQQNSTKDYPN